MFQSLALFIGLRFSRAKQRNKLVSFVSMSSTIGISVGVMVIIIGLSAMNGFEHELNNRVLAVIPHGQFEGVDAPVEAWKDIQSAAIENDLVLNAAPYVLFTALLEKGSHLTPVQIRGVDPQQEAFVSDIYRYVSKGDWFNFQANQQQVIIGQGIAHKLGVQKGDWITAMLPDATTDSRLTAPKRIRLQVAGILSLGGQVDHGLAMVPLEDAQTYLGLGNAVTGVSVKVQDPLDVLPVIREVGYSLEHYVYLKTWLDDYGYLYRDIQMVRSIMYLVMVLVIGVASFNIVSTLMMSVKDRAGDIAVLRTMGAKDSLVRSIFVWYGFLSGLFGSLIGSFLGCLIALNLTQIIDAMETLTGYQFLSGDIYFVDFLPTQLMISDVLLVSFTAMFLGLLATWYPAQRACQLQPAIVLGSK